jgi:hypothetical protein
MVNRAALTGCTGRDHESNKSPGSDDRGGGRGPRGGFYQMSKVNSLRGTNLIVHARFIYVPLRFI